MSDEPLTFNLEVAIHTILYVRQVYPPDLFVRRKKYETPVYQSRHPALNEYISGAVKAVSDEMAQGTVEKVVVVIKNKEQVPLERFIFSIDNMIEVESFNKSTGVVDAMTAKSLVQYFRSFLIKLCMIEASLGQMELGESSRRYFVRYPSGTQGSGRTFGFANQGPSSLDPGGSTAYDARNV
ncbi:hypothetical protein CC1G_01823 [Coprinopsis cinerea okayama7|uniref:HORMA domain-containing protein n=1 Tax=Coprinopsis cinerea (strain Okayama-7 / 130 / ATCC MYA-4618 / FGSC 9003) TaxID=240176 RepID=A8N2S1_COPC7|nr:hypothetical protein CC1G_01823 [Coprinopsis cinerea okayama7\|eukprot:XP_001829143.2 hypothetical protein CC1G_01823 [Coprinopsis cinerea okayama7\